MSKPEVIGGVLFIKGEADKEYFQAKYGIAEDFEQIVFEKEQVNKATGLSKLSFTFKKPLELQQEKDGYHQINKTTYSMKVDPKGIPYYLAQNGYSIHSYAGFNYYNLYGEKNVYGAYIRISQEGDLECKLPKEDVDFNDLYFALCSKFNYARIKLAFNHLKLCLPKYPQPKSEISTEAHKEILAGTELSRSLCIPIPQIESFNKIPTQISIEKAKMFVEMYAQNQDSKEKNSSEKVFLTKPKIYLCSLFTTIPILMTKTGNSVTVTFADFGSITSKYAFDKFTFASQIFNKSELFYNVLLDVIIPGKLNSSYLAEQSQRIDYSIIANKEQPSTYSFADEPEEPSIKPVTMELTFISATPDSSIEKLKEELDTIDKPALLYICPQCNRYSNEVPCPLNEHAGDRIPFSDGKMVHEDRFYDGYSAHTRNLFNYTCCGTVAEDAIGCGKVANHLEPETPDMIYSEVIVTKLN